MFSFPFFSFPSLFFSFDTLSRDWRELCKSSQTRSEFPISSSQTPQRNQSRAIPSSFFLIFVNGTPFFTLEFEDTSPFRYMALQPTYSLLFFLSLSLFPLYRAAAERRKCVECISRAANAYLLFFLLFPSDPFFLFFSMRRNHYPPFPLC